MTILGHIQACPTHVLAQQTFVILKKRWPKKKLFLAKPACTYCNTLYARSDYVRPCFYKSHHCTSYEFCTLGAAQDVPACGSLSSTHALRSAGWFPARAGRGCGADGVVPVDGPPRHPHLRLAPRSPPRHMATALPDQQVMRMRSLLRRCAVLV